MSALAVTTATLTGLVVEISRGHRGWPDSLMGALGGLASMAAGRL